MEESQPVPRRAFLIATTAVLLGEIRIFFGSTERAVFPASLTLLRVIVEMCDRDLDIRGNLLAQCQKHFQHLLLSYVAVVGQGFITCWPRCDLPEGLDRTAAEWECEANPWPRQ